MKANFDDKEFLTAVKNAEVGDIIKEEFADLTVVAKFGNEMGEYEERLAPTVLFRESYQNGTLLKKADSTCFVFIPNEVLI